MRRKAPRCTEVTLSITVLEVHSNRSHLLNGKGSVDGRLSTHLVACPATHGRHAGRFQRRVGLCSRFGSMFDHRSDLDSGCVSSWMLGAQAAEAR